jgi:hypothetical protein
MMGTYETSNELAYTDGTDVKCVHINATDQTYDEDRSITAYSIDLIGG